ncbi:exonuclease mut-7 homolog isoform X7 [Canis lupus dingo]|uniref:exonuclease mut-7 homolog isoform X7 n=1 Tax=Canis lupus dingo TaxID=286419 RepID=UPI0020C525F4|nr:exonuclease mut-7 homolog isoform X7 [Canis lupus dingo]
MSGVLLDFSELPERLGVTSDQCPVLLCTCGNPCIEAAGVATAHVPICADPTVPTQGRSPGKGAVSSDPHSGCLWPPPAPPLRMDPAGADGDPAAGNLAADGTAGDPGGNPVGSEYHSVGQDPFPFLQALQKLWSTRELQQLREEAWRGFDALDDPRTGLLAMLESSRGWQQKGPSLESWLTCQLQHWLQAQPLPGPAQAALLGMKLKLQPGLDVEKMSIPLLLQDKVNLVERYVAGFPDLQRRLLALLDSWCQPDFDIRVVARQHPQVMSPRLERLSPRALSQQVLSLLERHGLDPALCPNVVTQRRLATLRYLCYKRLVEGSMSQENWTDHVQCLVGQDEWLQEELLRLLASPDNKAAAAQCALDLSLPEERLSAPVATELRRLKLQERRAEAPLEDRRDGYYQPPISREDIHFLASWEDLARHEAELLQPGQVVGVDLEWRPSFGTGGRPQASIMQVAVGGRVFLLDLPLLSQPTGGQASQAFCRLVSQLLSDPSITKLGYGMAGDLRSLGASCPTLAHVEKQLRGGLDLLQVHRQMRIADMPALGRGEARGLRGLSLLVQQVLGRPLDKAQQLSNWDRRPLSEEQLVYAAADAYCLLEVYQTLCREPASFSLSEDLAKSLRPGHSERSGPQELPRLQVAPALAWQEPAAKEDMAPGVPARAFRVVCDNMLQGLARSLRCLGVDVLALGTDDDHRRAAEVARQEGRIILTSGLPYHKLRAQVGAGRCLSVDCSLKARQQAKAVLKHFNVCVTHADIFSRCQACNCDRYLKVSKDMMRQLVRLGSPQEDAHSTGDKADPSEDLQDAGDAPDEAPRGGYTSHLSCRWLEAADLQSHAPATLANGTRLQLARVPEGVLWRPDLRHFYCCSGCGKVFWEGSHLGRVTSHFSEVLNSAAGSQRQPKPPGPASGPPAQRPNPTGLVPWGGPRQDTLTYTDPVPTPECSRLPAGPPAQSTARGDTVCP